MGIGTVADALFTTNEGVIMKRLLLTITIAFACWLSIAPAHAQDGWVLKYSPYNNTHQYVPPDAQLRYNPYNNQYQWARPDSQLRYNPYNNQYRYVPPDAQLRYNPYSNQHQFTCPDAHLRYNPYNNVSFRRACLAVQGRPWYGRPGTRRPSEPCQSAVPLSEQPPS